MKKYISEFIGTFSMIFCGTGAMTVNEVTGGEVTHVGIAITWGLIVMAMIYAFGETFLNSDKIGRASLFKKGVS